MIVLTIQVLHKNSDMNILIKVQYILCGTQLSAHMVAFLEYIPRSSSPGETGPEGLCYRGLRTKLLGHGMADTVLGTVLKWTFRCLGATTAPKNEVLSQSG